MVAPELTHARWITSSYSENGADCVQLAQGDAWVKSSYSENGEACVEVARGDAWTAVRDSKTPEGPALLFSRAAMEQFLAGVRASEFDQ